MAIPWWQYFAISEESAYVLPESERKIAIFLMLLTLFIITPQLIVNLHRLRISSSHSGSKAERNYALMYIGVYLTFLNSFILRLSIYLTNGEFSVLGQEKGFLFLIGITVYLTGLVYVAFTIINFRSRTKKIIRIIFTLFIIIALFVMLTQILIIMGNTSIIDTSLTLQTFAAAMGISFLMVFISSFLFEMTYDPSKIERLRLILLSIGVTMMVFQLLGVGLASLAKRTSDPQLFVNVSTYIIPLSYLIGQPIMYLVFNWSLFTPTWLLIRAKVIQPSFREFLRGKR